MNKKRNRVYNRIYNTKDWELVNDNNKSLLDDFLLNLKKENKSQGTINQYKNDLRIVFLKILKDYENKSILEMNKKEFKFLLTSFYKSNSLSLARCNRIKSACSSLLNFTDDEYCKYDLNYNQKIKGLSEDNIEEIQFLNEQQSFVIKNKLIQLLENNNINIILNKSDKNFPLIYIENLSNNIENDDLFQKYFEIKIG